MFGKGTEYVTQLLRKLLPHEKNIIQVDSDTVSQLTPHARARMHEGKNNAIVVGTQAIFTALQDRKFDNAVFLFPEQALLYPDFRSEERTYLTLMRLQQMIPSSQPVTMVTRSERLLRERLVFPSYDEQMRQRRRLGYPPLRDVVLLTLQAKRSTTAHAQARKIYRAIMEQHPSPAVTLRGPFQSFRQKRGGKHEYHILLLGPLDQLVALYAGLPHIRVDLDPQRIL
jgi:primosomal protein N' (replication factor Y)